MLVDSIHRALLADIKNNSNVAWLQYFSETDTYIRKAAYTSVGKIYSGDRSLLEAILQKLSALFEEEDELIRQTVVNAAGEIGKSDFPAVASLMRQGLFDEHHKVRNAVIGSIKKMGQHNPKPVLAFARNYLHHPDKEIRREICHGIELRGRTHPEEVLPLLKELEFDPTARVRNTLIHVLGQIAYKKGCLEKVIEHLKTWENQAVVAKAIEEIIDVHRRYAKFSYKSQQEAIDYIQEHFDH